MKIDAGTFFIMVGTIAAAGVGGYFLSQKGLIGAPPPSPTPAPTPAPTTSPPASAASSPVAAASSTPPPVSIPDRPACDDNQGTPGECPPIGWSAEEGGCGNFTNKRCNECKQAFMPRVAAAAVDCINKLNARERCDKFRVNLCGHLALMNACLVPEMIKGDDPKQQGSVANLCEGIAKDCASAPQPPPPIDCRQTLAGMNDAGRTRMSQCMKAHCSDLGLLGCEATPP
jgi:hypothetical protein